MRIAMLVAGLSLALATSAVADVPAGTYGPGGPYPSVLRQDETRSQDVERANKADEAQVSPTAANSDASYAGRGLPNALPDASEGGVFRPRIPMGR